MGSELEIQFGLIGDWIEPENPRKSQSKSEKLPSLMSFKNQQKIMLYSHKAETLFFNQVYLGQQVQKGKKKKKQTSEVDVEDLFNETIPAFEFNRLNPPDLGWLKQFSNTGLAVVKAAKATIARVKQLLVPHDITCL